MGAEHSASLTNEGGCSVTVVGPHQGRHGVEDELVVGCAGLVPASVPSMRVSVGSGGRDVSEVSSDPVRDGRERGTHQPGLSEPP